MSLLLLGVCSSLLTDLSFIECLAQTDHLPPTLMLHNDVIYLNNCNLGSEVAKNRRQKLEKKNMVQFPYQQVSV